ncbi:MAG: hypothetical protein RLZZ162_103 [Verrucomicrobiota bacterium]|jgi:hypothetical protein
MKNRLRGLVITALLAAGSIAKIDGLPLIAEGCAADLIAVEEVRLLRTRDTKRPFLHVVTFKAPA